MVCGRVRFRAAATVAAAAFLLLAGAAWGHFVVLIPSQDNVGAGGRTVSLEVLFTHPMADGPVMEMARPRRFGVQLRGRKTDLSATLVERKVRGRRAWTASYTISRPGDHIFFVEPEPYWEPAERKWIVHYTKVVVNGLDRCEGWDVPVGLPVEIEPLVRPYGLWKGNVFRGVVRRGGRPVPFATVEVEYRNVGGKVRPPGEAFVTQVVKADANGVFCYAMPRAGWWGFAALVAAEQKRPGPDGEPAEVELGGVMWLRAVEMK